MLHRSLGAALALAFAGCAAGTFAPPAPGAAPPRSGFHQPFGAGTLAQKLKQRYLSETDINDGTDIAAGKDGDLWVGDQCTGIIRVTASGNATSFPYDNPPSGCSDPISLTPGIGGAVWFVDPYLNAVGRISPKGKITFYKLPSVSSCNVYPSAPNGIVEGPDGAMWFTTQNPGDTLCYGFYATAIGRITANGTMKLYYTSPKNTGHGYSPSGYITAGADGALYFPSSDPSSHLVVGRVTTGGSISFSGEVTCKSSVLCTPNTAGIVEGPDGKIWISEYYDGVVIRYSGGSEGFSVFQVPGDTGGNSNPYGPRSLTSGPDGALWFATYTADDLGRVSKNGSIKLESLSASGFAHFGGIATRSKSLWFVVDPEQLGEATL